VLIPKVPYRPLSGGFRGGVKDSGRGFGAESFVLLFGPGVPVRGSECVTSFGRVGDSGEGRGYNKGFELGPGVLVGGV